MADTTTGANRHFGASFIKRFTELRRQAVVATSEIVEGDPGSPTDFPRLVSVVRRQETGPGSPVAGIAPTYAEVGGLTDLIGHVRTQGQWRNEVAGGERVEIEDAQRIVTVLDVPTGGGIEAERVLLTDRLRFDDPLLGETVWRVISIRTRPSDGLVVCLTEYAKEEYA